MVFISEGQSSESVQLRVRENTASHAGLYCTLDSCAVRWACDPYPIVSVWITLAGLNWWLQFRTLEVARFCARGHRGSNGFSKESETEGGAEIHQQNRCFHVSIRAQV